MSTSWSSSRRAKSRMGASSRCRTCSSHYCSAGLSWLPPKRCPRFLVHASWPKHRMSFEPRDYLRHILLETEYLISQTRSLSFEAFIANPTLSRAFVRSLEIIGEAAKKVPGDLRARYPDVRPPAVEEQGNEDSPPKPAPPEDRRSLASAVTAAPHGVAEGRRCWPPRTQPALRVVRHSGRRRP